MSPAPSTVYTTLPEEQTRQTGLLKHDIMPLLKSEALESVHKVASSLRSFALCCMQPLIRIFQKKTTDLYKAVAQVAQ